MATGGPDACPFYPPLFRPPLDVQPPLRGCDYLGDPQIANGFRTMERASTVEAPFGNIDDPVEAVTKAMLQH